MQATATHLTILGERANEPRVKQNEPRLLDHIRTVQELLGHKDVRTTMVYTHVLNRGGRGVKIPADML